LPVLGDCAVIHMLSNLDRFSEWVFYATLRAKFWPMQKIASVGATVAVVIGAIAAAGRHLISRWDWAKARG
jgi:hypothetical protein